MGGQAMGGQAMGGQAMGEQAMGGQAMGGQAMGGENDPNLARIDSLIINEIDYDQPNIDDVEFIEIFNPTLSAVDLDRVEIHLISQSRSNVYQIHQIGLLLREQGYVSTLLESNQYLVMGSQRILDASPLSSLKLNIGEENLIQNGPNDGLLLINQGTSTLLDSISYEGFVDEVSEGMEGASRDNDTGSLSRCMNGQDQDQNHLDFVQTPSPTPGASNSCP